MLYSVGGQRPKEIGITEEQWKEILNLTFDGIKRKLVSARMLIDQDNDISAGHHENLEANPMSMDSVRFVITTNCIESKF
jgi:hypothetical protein